MQQIRAGSEAGLNALVPQLRDGFAAVLHSIRNLAPACNAVATAGTAFGDYVRHRPAAAGRSTLS